MEHNPPKDKLGLGVAATFAAIVLLSLAQHPSVDKTSSSDAQERDAVLTKYGVSSQAQSYIDKFPFYNRHTTQNGGGYSHLGQYWEVYSDQEEAIVHEASHMYSTKVMSPEFCAVLDETVKEDGATSEYLKTLYQVPGMVNNCTEEYASISSYSMGEQAKLPVNLQGFYKSLYTWKP